MTTPLIVLGAIIILSLAVYAASLLLKLRRQTQEQQARQVAQQIAQAAKEKELLGNIHYIAAAMVEERCELSEGVMRIGKLFGIIGQSDSARTRYPFLFQHFDIIESHPIMEERKALAKQQRMKLDFIRMKSEAELEEKIHQEVNQIVKEYSVHVNQ